MRRWLVRLLLVALIAAAAGLLLTRPEKDGPQVLAGLEGDAGRGKLVFDAAGCAACHSAKGAEGDARLVLKGGRRFASPFGTFVAPNISQDKANGIGAWSALDLWNALDHGTSKDGRHLYPAFPYPSYQRMTPAEVVDLAAYLRTLPADATPSRPHELRFPFDIRAGLGLWKALFLRPGWVMQGDLDPEEKRGRVLVEALGHCGECHTPRNLFGATETGPAWLTGAPIPGSRNRTPDLTPPRMSWSRADLVEYFTSGFTPEFDTAGGAMVEVIDNLSRLPESDREAIAAYLGRLPVGG